MEREGKGSRGRGMVYEDVKWREREKKRDRECSKTHRGDDGNERGVGGPLR